MSMFFRSSIVFALVLSLLPAVVSAQTVTVRGRVIDPQGGAVVGASVTLTGLSTPRTTRTTIDGTFSLDNLVPGTYTLQTPGGKNLGYGRESEYGTGNILFYKPNGDRWFTVKPNQVPSGRERGDSGGGGRRGR